MNILLIEDNPDHALLVNDLLGEDAKRVEVQKTLALGLDRLKNAPYDICLCDLNLADSTIEDTIAALSDLKVKTPVVVLTTIMDATVDEKLIASGIQDFLPKSDLSRSILERACRHAIQRKKILNQKEEEARTDPLTGLFNRREFDAITERYVAQTKRQFFPITLCMIDVDKFKNINDQHGHHTGDLALIRISKAIKETFRETDLAARLGGDEFVVLLPYSDAELAASFAARLRTYMTENPLVIEGETIPVTISIGLSELNPKDSQQQWLQAADEAMYEAKTKGRDRIYVDND